MASGSENQRGLCPSQWGRGQLETPMLSYRTCTQIPSLAGIHLVAGGGAAAQEAQGPPEEGLSCVAFGQELEGQEPLMSLCGA